MKRVIKQAIKRAIRSLEIAQQPKTEATPQEANDKHLTHLLHSVKNDMDEATKELNGSTSTERTEYHAKAESAADELLDEFFVNGDIESIRALASGLIGQLSETQAKEHLEALQEHYETFVKGE